MSDTDGPFVSMQAEFVKRFGHDIGVWLSKRVAVQIRKTGIDPCMDNWRIADMSKPDEMAEYDRRASNGCCGSSDVEYHHYKTGTRISVGFNYGH